MPLGVAVLIGLSAQALSFDGPIGVQSFADPRNPPPYRISTNVPARRTRPVGRGGDSLALWRSRARAQQVRRPRPARARRCCTGSRRC